ncbi:protein UL84 [Cercopithecine betaherpesvirus 5]|uniref:Protein UL84 n=1 Tax=Simian cytomegalovirus (strain Colburn) TaxID=50292 RepID=G8XTE7_SCMVC|nr:protein UL84 [Cercopithecine betaherpesvirus 5]AEV80439.1 protein UL84 [Cercopithecine betaherpesvirus 5]
MPRADKTLRNGPRGRPRKASNLLQSDETILTLTDQHHVKRPLTREGTFRLIQLNVDFQPTDLEHPFQILLSTPMQLEPITPHRDPEERGLLCAAGNGDSDILPIVSLFSAQAGSCNILRAVIDEQLTQMSIVRLSLNIFALKTMPPLRHQLPLRRKVTHHTTLHDCVSLHMPDLTFATDETSNTPELTIPVKSALCWQTAEGGISGPRGLASRISVKLSESTIENMGPAIFGQLYVDDGSPDLVLSSLILYQDGILRFNVTFRSAQHQLPSNPVVSFRLRLRRQTVARPFFSDTPLPYFLPRNDGNGGLDVCLPYDLALKTSHLIRIYRRFYGPFLGLFIPHNRQELNMPVTIWLPRTWLEINVVSENAYIPKNTVLGQLYFISSKHSLNRGRLSALAHQVKSAVHQVPHQLSLLGASIALQDLVPIRLSRPNPEAEQATQKPVTFAMVCNHCVSSPPP